MQPRLLLESITFSDGTKINTSDANIIVLVGPNTSGKSSTLREIQDGAGLSGGVGPVVQSVTFQKQGTPAELKLWLEQNVQKVRKPYERESSYTWLGKGCSEVDVEERWKHTNIGGLNGILCTLIDVEKRLEVANNQDQIDFFSQAPSHPMHVLYKNGDLEQKVNEAFRAAFKTDVVLNSLLKNSQKV